MHRVAAALLVLGALAVPANADHERYLTVSGNGLGYVDVRFPSPVRLEGGLTKFRTTGRAAGVYVRPLTKGVTASQLVLSVRDLGIVGDTGAVSFPAGTYRVYLVADGRASVRLLATGLRQNVSVRADRKAPVTFSEGPVDVRTDGLLRYRGERVTRVRGDGYVTFTAYRMTLPPSTVPTWGDVSECFGEAADCDTATDGYYPERRTSATGQTTHPAGTLHAGPLRQRYAGTADARVWVMVLEIPR